MDTLQLQLGSDPEFFLRNPSNFLVASGHVLSGKLDGYFVPYTDGFQGEFTVPPASSIKDALVNIRMAMLALKDACDTYGLDAFAAPAVSLTDEELATVPPNAFEFGCQPSINAYTSQKRDSSLICSLHNKQRNVMMAGGHIHIGFPKGHEEDDKYRAPLELSFVDTLRIFEAVGVTLLTAYEDSYPKEHADIFKKRRLFYGLAGEYRTKPHGLEIRSPSSMWLSDPMLAEMIYSTAVVSYYSVLLGYHREALDKLNIKETSKAINSSDSKRCMRIAMTTIDMLKSRFGQHLSNYKNIFDVFYKTEDLINKKNINIFPSLIKTWQHVA